MEVTQKYISELTYTIIGCAIEVHRHIGPGLYERIYEKCMIKELYLNGLETQSQQIIPVDYKGLLLDAELRYDILVEEQVVVELKAADAILPIHEAVLLTYMRLLKKPKGVIINFNCTNIFKYGQKTFVNELYSKLPKG